MKWNYLENKLMSLKIAYCIPSLYSVSGMEKTLTIKANYFAEVLNYKIIIILTDGKGMDSKKSLNERILVLNFIKNNLQTTNF